MTTPSDASRRTMTPEDVAVYRTFFKELTQASPEARTMFATMMAQIRCAQFAAVAEAPSPEARQLADTLAAQGVVDLGALVDSARVADMRGHFESCPTYGSHAIEHADPTPRDVETLRRSGAHYACYTHADILRCPHLLEIANDPRLLQAAEAYLGCPPTIYSLNAWWSLAQGGTPARDAQGLHRDPDDFRFVTLFIFLTPVGPTNGAHRYIRYSHDRAALARAAQALGYPEAQASTDIAPLFHANPHYAVPAVGTLIDQVEMVWTGPAGAAIMADTYGLHMGVPLTEGERLMVWVRYGLGPTATSFGGGEGRHAGLVQPRIPQTPRGRYVNRLLLTE